MPALGTASTNVESAIREMVRRLVARFHPERIILFGSHARGEAGPDSDVGLLVVLPGPLSKKEQTIEVHLARVMLFTLVRACASRKGRARRS